jgi:hemerythrin-like domain-containing protein
MITRDPGPENRGHPRGAGCAQLVEAMPPSLLDEPLAYIFADHFRQRRICSALRRFALAGRMVHQEADAVVSFLSNDVPLNHADEEEDLFPAVRHRELRGDNLGGIIARLLDDHRLATPIVGRIVAALSCRSVEAVEIGSAARALMETYASSESGHLALENGIVLAIARVRLTSADLEGMARRMKARRGISH